MATDRALSPSEGEGGVSVRGGGEPSRVPSSSGGGGGEGGPLKRLCRMYCVLNLSPPTQASSDDGGDCGGSIQCYRFAGLSKKDTNSAYAPPRFCGQGENVERLVVQGSGGVGSGSSYESSRLLRIDLPADLPWVVRDVNDASTFVVEVSAMAVVDADGSKGGGDAGDLENHVDHFEDDDDDDEDGSGLYNFWGGDDEDDDDEAQAEMTVKESTEAGDDHSGPEQQVYKDMRLAATKGKSMVRYHFRCRSNRNEKYLWLRAFENLGRLSSQARHKKKIFGEGGAISVSAPAQRRSRMRTVESADLARRTTEFERGVQAQDSRGPDSKRDVDDAEGLKEYRVCPTYAYPHRWMTHNELTGEMLLSSSRFHDLRLSQEKLLQDKGDDLNSAGPGLGPGKCDFPQEVALLRVEVLECVGLPRLGGTDPNAAVYICCGSYAFTTDVIPSCVNPMWLRLMKRGCAIPVFHGYATLYAGVFHDTLGGSGAGVDSSDGPASASASGKDTFIGRAAVELSRLRPGLTYDVILPLRVSSHVYSRKRRGAVRLRFRLDCDDLGAFALSYLPPLLRPRRINNGGDVTSVGTAVAAADTTIACADPRSFRNVVLTVHGTHLPDKFSTDQLMAAVREFKLLEKCLKRLLNQFGEDLVVWRNPTVSAFVFLAWMHCVYADSVVLVLFHGILFLLLQLIRNYSHAFFGGRQRGDLLPQSWEDIFCTVRDFAILMISRLRRCSSTGKEEERGASLRSFRDGAVAESNGPKGKLLLRILGFVDEINYGSHRCSEFPFSSLAGYPQFGVDQSLATTKGVKNGPLINSGELAVILAWSVSLCFPYVCNLYTSICRSLILILYNFVLLRHQHRPCKMNMATFWWKDTR